MPAPADDALTPLNEPLIARVLEQIRAHPDSWDQGEWAQSSYTCGTTACFAGWAAQLNGHAELLWSSYSDSEYDPEDLRVATAVRVDTGEVVHVREFAQRVLGLTRDEADRLFSAPSHVAVVRDLLDQFRAARTRKETQP